MHTNAISRVTENCVTKINEGTMTPESAKAISDLCRTEISNWRIRLEYARHTGQVVTISELEPENNRLRKAA